MKRIALSLILAPLAACQLDNGELPARTLHVVADYEGDHAELDTSFPAIDFGSRDARCGVGMGVGNHDPEDWNCPTTVDIAGPVTPNPVVASIRFEGSSADEYRYIVGILMHDDDPGAPDRVPLLETWTFPDSLGVTQTCHDTALPCTVTVSVEP